MARKLDIARRTELAARALEVLAGRGVHRTTMSDLASELGLKRPTLYFYFKDLEAVFEAVFEDVQARYMTHVSRRLADVAHPIVALEAVLDATIEFHAERRDLIVVLFQLWAASGSRDPERVIARGRELVEPARAALIAKVAEGLRRGEVGPCDPTLLVDLTLTVLDGALVQHVTGGADVPPVVAEFRRLVLAPLMIAAPAIALRPTPGLGRRPTAPPTPIATARRSRRKS